MSDLFRTERAAEIRRLLARQSALLDDLLEGQREFGRRLGGSTGLTTELSGLPAELDGLEHTTDRGFAELNSRIEHVTQLVRQLVDMKAKSTPPPAGP
ncbi:hypothetical protein [Amycolatopsis sp. lyj-23]|uniref:hypothetical protein n=1 Tax=Amycolatopsis sp. lyj-23 TaxID=2789283 RepID=UPI00397E2BAB